MDFILTTVLVNEKSRASKCSVPRSSSKLKSWLVRDQWFSGRWLLIISLVRGDRNNMPVVDKSTEIIKAGGKVHANEYL